MSIKHYAEVAALKTIEEYQAQLKLNRWTLLPGAVAGASGGGIYQHPSNASVVVKILSAPPTGSDLLWVKWCRKNRNPWAVKVLKVKPLPVKPDNGMVYYAVYMEKLKPASAQQVSTELQYAGAAGRNGSPVLYLAGKKWYFVQGFNGVMPEFMDKDLAKVLTVLYKLTRLKNGRNPGSLDLKPTNFLLRGTQLVFVDPIL